ncbi:hypothetical protein ACFL46_03665 [Candidatus Neomarinimicrobiota bacterium]
MKKLYIQKVVWYHAVLLATILFVCNWSSNVHAQNILPALDEIKMKLSEQYMLVKDYSVKVNVAVNTPRLRMPGKRIKLYFKQPNQTKLEAKGFAIFPKNGLMENPVELLDNLSELSPIGKGIENDREHWILTGFIKQDSSHFTPWGDSDAGRLSLQIWIDQEHWTITQTKTFLDSTQVMLIRSEYLEVGSGIYLPEKTLIRFELDKSVLERIENFSEMGFSTSQSSNKYSHRKIIPTEGTITLEFFDYILNKGLPDELFIEDKKSD